jgi:hypothetical protein
MSEVQDGGNDQTPANPQKSMAGTTNERGNQCDQEYPFLLNDD